MSKLIRRPGQSQLDYLWVNYGSYFVSENIEEGSIPTSKLLHSVIDNISKESVNSLKVVGNLLIGVNKLGEQIFSLDITELVSGGRTIVGFGKRYITKDDVDDGCVYSKDTPVYSLLFSDGSELIAPIDEYNGSETNNVVINIDGHIISAEIKINNDTSIVPIISTKKGILADLKISSEIESIQLTKELEGLKAKILLDNEGRSLKFRYLTLENYINILEPDATTVYFIQGKKYFYFGKYLIGEGTTNLDNYYTKQEIDANLATKLYVTDLLAGIGMNWNTI